MSTTKAPVVEGDVLAGKYRVDRVLGVGGMGVVVAAHHIHLDEKVAIKFLLPEMVFSAEATERFAREARAAVKIKSEHVARVSDVGTLENGAPYMVMEYLEGGDLADWVQEKGPLDVEQAIELVLQACEALAEAHGLGIIHRDLKPANLFVIRRPDGLLSVKVLDFGISKATRLGGSGPDLSMTKTAAVMGSPLYMSPEQLASAKTVDARTDIWAMGIVLYELLTGRQPFHADTLPELVAQILTSEPAPMADLRADVPAGLDPVVRRCLEKDRTRRFDNVAELAHALFPFAPLRSRASVERVGRVIQNAGLSTSSPELPLEARLESKHSSTAAAWGQTAPPDALPRWRPLLWLGGTGAIVVMGGLAYFASRNPDESAAPADTTLPVGSTLASEPVEARDPAAAPPAPAIEPARSAASPSAADSVASPPKFPSTTPTAAPSPAPKVRPPPSPRVDTKSPVQPAAPTATAARRTPDVFDDRK